MSVLEKFKSLKLLFINQEVKEPSTPQKKPLLPLGTEQYINIDDVIIPKEILYSHPRPQKIKEYIRRFKELGYLDKPITVEQDKSYPNSPCIILRDGYIRLIIAKKFNFKKVPIRFVD